MEASSSSSSLSWEQRRRWEVESSEEEGVNVDGGSSESTADWSRGMVVCLLSGGERFSLRNVCSASDVSGSRTGEDARDGFDDNGEDVDAKEEDG